MTVGTFTATLPLIVVDPIDYLLVDIATGRHLPGGSVHAQQLAHEHGLAVETAQAALDTAWELGLVARGRCPGSATVTWTPERTQSHLHRLARLMIGAARACDREAARPDIIDGEHSRHTSVEMFGLNLPSDLDLFLELGRALLGRSMPSLADELIAPVAILFSEAAQRVHGLDFAASASARDEIVSEMVRSLLDGHVDSFAELVADYMLAMSVD